MPTALRVRHLRRARVPRKRRPPYSRDEVFARHGGMCAYCENPAEHLDHVVPLSLGGADVEANVLPACAECDHRKGALSLAEWALTFAPEIPNP